MLQTALHFLRDLGARNVIDEDLDTGLQRIGARNQFTHGRAAPHEAALLCEINLCIRRVVETIRPQMELRSQRLQRCSFDRFIFGNACAFVLAKAEPVQLANKFAFNGYFTGLVYFGHHGFLLS